MASRRKHRDRLRQLLDEADALLDQVPQPPVEHSEWYVCPIVGCGAHKKDHAAPARELYTSTLFRLSMQYAEAIARPAGNVLVASAKHGLVEAGAVLEPYEHELQPSERIAWGREAMLALVRRFARQALDEPPTGRALRCRYPLLMGERYALPIAYSVERMNAEARRMDLDGGILVCEEPLQGMQIGERLQWLRRQLDARVN